MSKAKLATKILIVSIFILFIFSLASFGILFRALSNQSSREMDQLLKNEALALSALVNSSGNNSFDFEMPSNFMDQFRQRNPNGFFRFIDPRNGNVLKESKDAAQVGCLNSSSNVSIKSLERTYRIETLIFRPELDREADTTPHSQDETLCVVVGIDQAPYWNVLMETLLSSIPILILIVVLLVIVLLVLIRGLTKDLFSLASALTTANFGGTHSFPTLPKARTQEVKAIIDVLEDLHEQASEVYREMWLFMGRAAHQIKTPVTAMQATLDVLLRKERSKEELLMGLQDVQSAAILLNGLTRKLISSSRISYEASPLTEGIELNFFFNELADVFKSKADMAGIKIKVDSKESLIVVGNRTLMSDIFGNLIENAILYSPEQKNAYVSISWHKDGNNAAIEVADQGPGFPESIKNDLFKPFVRGDERKAVGSGLGLSIAKKSANLLGGDIKLIASTRHGSIMQVLLPIG